MWYLIVFSVECLSYKKGQILIYLPGSNRDLNRTIFAAHAHVRSALERTGV